MTASSIQHEPGHRARCFYAEHAALLLASLSATRSFQQGHVMVELSSDVFDINAVEPYNNS